MHVTPEQAIICSHAVLRSQQRGIKPSDRDIVFYYADREEPAGSGVWRLSLSRLQLQSLINQRVITAQQAERCARLTLVTDERRIFTNYRTPRTH